MPRPYQEPAPAIAEPRQPLLVALLAFVRDARSIPGVLRIALIGSLATAKPIPKDADVLVTIGDMMDDLAHLAQAGRRLKGFAQTINLGADIFLADKNGDYIGRVCNYRECHPRSGCLAQHCGRREHLNDDLHIVALSSDLVAAPPVEFWPSVIRRVPVPQDVETLLLAKLEQIEK